MEQNLKSLLNCEFLKPFKGENIEPGVICSTIFPFIPDRNLKIIQPLSTDPVSPNSRKYHLFSKDFGQLRTDLTKSLMPPHYELGLRSNEVALVIKAKDRPVIVLTPVLAEDTKGFPSHFKNCVLCAPLYTLVDHNNEMNPNYNPITVQAVVGLKYRAVFPIVTYPYLKSRICGLRLDRITPVRTEVLTKPEYKVTEECFTFICEWVRFYATGRLGGKKKPENLVEEKETTAETLSAARGLLLEALAKQGDK